MATHKITLDLAKKDGIPPEIIVRVGEHGKQYVRATIMDNGIAANIPEEAKVVLQIQRLDGGLIRSTATRDSANVYTAQIPSQAFIYYGVSKLAYFAVYTGDEDAETTQDFRLIVLPGTTEEEAVRYFDQEINELNDGAQKLAEDARAATKNANDAADRADSSIAAAKTATQKADEATESAKKATSDANTAKANADAAADKANSAATSATTSAGKADEAAASANASANAAGAAATAANNATSSATTAAGRANSAADEAEAFLKGFTVEYENLSEECKEYIAQSAASGVEFATQGEIDQAFEDEILPILAGGEMDNALTPEEFEWAISDIFA